MNALRILQRPLRLDFKEFEGLNFAIVKTDANFAGLDLTKADGIFIENESPEVVSKIIKEVRSSEVISMYLKPLFIKSLSIPTEIVQLTDGRVEDLTMNKALQKSLEINERVKGIQSDAQATSATDEDSAIQPQKADATVRYGSGARERKLHPRALQLAVASGLSQSHVHDPNEA